MTPAQRLAILIPVVNDDELSEKALRQRFLRFLNHLDEVGGLSVVSDAGLWESYGQASLPELKATQHKLQILFAVGLSDSLPDITPLSFPSLRFGTERVGDQWVLRVDAGRLRDLVGFVATWLLTHSDVRVRRCNAPRKQAWAQTCDRVIVWSGRGRPPEMCPGTACSTRKKSKQRNERNKEMVRRENEELKRSRRKRR